MKILHFSLLFLILLIPVVFTTDTKRRAGKELDTAIRTMDQTLEQATLSAAEKLPEAEEKSWDIAADAFFSSIYLSLGIKDDLTAQLTVQDYCPVCAVITPSYLTVLHIEKVTVADGSTDLKRVWSNRIPYVYTDTHDGTGFTYLFLGEGLCEIYDSDGILSPIGEKLCYTIDLSDPDGELFTRLLAQVRDPAKVLLLNRDTFEDIRIGVMASTCEKYLASYISEYNALAWEKGITYEFAFPSEAVWDIRQGCNGTSFMAFFQGYPLQLGNMTYNRYTSAGAQATLQAEYVTDASGWYHLPLNVSVENGEYYHYSDGSLISVVHKLHSEKECAAEGAVPCPECYPHLTWYGR